MTRRRKAAAAPERESARLPESGLSDEILALWEDGPPALEAPPEAAAAPGAVPAGPERLYALADRLAARTAAPEETPEEPETWITVEVAGEIYALPVDSVEEVLRVGGITRLPYAPAPVRGITQQRGRVLTVVDLRVRLGFEPLPVDSRSRICIVSSRGRSLGLLVDAARHVVKLLPSGKSPAPAEVMTERSAFILGVYRLADGLAILLDVDRVLLLDDGGEAPAGEEGMS